VGAALGFTGSDYVLVLPITLLTLFAIGILLIDLMLAAEDKWVNAVTALFGVAFAAFAILAIVAVSPPDTNICSVALMPP